MSLIRMAQMLQRYGLQPSRCPPRRLDEEDRLPLRKGDPQGRVR